MDPNSILGPNSKNPNSQFPDLSRTAKPKCLFNILCLKAHDASALIPSSPHLRTMAHHYSHSRTNLHLSSLVLTWLNQVIRPYSSSSLLLQCLPHWLLTYTKEDVILPLKQWPLLTSPSHLSYHSFLLPSAGPPQLPYFQTPHLSSAGSSDALALLGASIPRRYHLIPWLYTISTLPTPGNSSSHTTALTCFPSSVSMATLLTTPSALYHLSTWPIHLADARGETWSHPWFPSLVPTLI